MTDEPTDSDYELLKRSGHSPAKAAEIVLDAQRGDKFCIGWIAEARAREAKAKGAAP